MTIRIEPDGSILLIHHTQTLQTIAPLLHGKVETRRASNVEPVPQGTHCHSDTQLPHWNVDLRPVEGPASLGKTFATREEALEAEVLWIQTNILARRLHAA
jgi:hypothetical protein